MRKPTKSILCFAILSLLPLISLVSCARWPGIFAGQASAVRGPIAWPSLYAQLIAAYPLLDESEDFVVLCDFETADQLDYFELNGPAKSHMFHSPRPTATGKGSLGLRFDQGGDYSLVFTPYNRRWTGNNVLLAAIYCQDRTRCTVEITNAAGRTYRRSVPLDARGWNKLEFDLLRHESRIDLDNVSQVVFTFHIIGKSSVYLDDLILAKDSKALLGSTDGQEATMYIVREGKHYRIGSIGRFELTFLQGTIVSWYDLKADPARKENLAAPHGFGPFLYEPLPIVGQLAQLQPVRAVTSVRTRLSATTKAKTITVAVDKFYGPKATGTPDLSITYKISSDGQVKIDARSSDPSKPLALTLAVADNRRFEPVLGKIRRPHGPAESKIEFALLRRVGIKAGTDMLAAFALQDPDAGPLTCRVLPADKAPGLTIAFEGKPGQNPGPLRGLLRFWPDDIDHIANAERYIRDAFGRSDAGLIQPKPKEKKRLWAPKWKVGK